MQKPDIIFKVQTKIIDLVFEHGYSFNTHSKSKSCIFCTVNSGGLQEHWDRPFRIPGFPENRYTCKHCSPYLRK